MNWELGNFVLLAFVVVLVFLLIIIVMVPAAIIGGVFVTIIGIYGICTQIFSKDQ